jgi:hypothetical protein
MTGHHKRRSARNDGDNGSGSGSSSQNNISYLSFSAICQASALFKASVSDCRANHGN